MARKSYDVLEKSQLIVVVLSPIVVVLSPIVVVLSPIVVVLSSDCGREVP